MHGQLHARCPLRLVRWARSVPRPAQSHSGCIAGRRGRARPARVAMGRDGTRNLRRGSRLRRHGACLPYSDTLRDGLSWTGHTFRLSSQCETQCSWYTQPQPPKLSMHGETCIPVLLHWLPVGRGSDGASRRNRSAGASDRGAGGGRRARATRSHFWTSRHRQIGHTPAGCAPVHGEVGGDCRSRLLVPCEVDSTRPTSSAPGSPGRFMPPMRTRCTARDRQEVHAPATSNLGQGGFTCRARCARRGREGLRRVILREQPVAQPLRSHYS